MTEAPLGSRYDVAVIGGGPAGIGAASTAAEAGRRTILLEESPRPGGQIWRHLDGAAPEDARPWLRRLAGSGAELCTAAAVVDVERVDVGPGAGFRLLVERNGAPRTLEAGAVIVATGARELFLPFPGWTLPNVMGVGGAQALLKSGAVFAGKRVVVAGSGPLLLPVSAALATAGAEVRFIAEQAPLRRVASFAGSLWSQPRKLREAAAYRRRASSAPYRTGSWVLRARGEERVEEVELSIGGKSRTFGCDVLCTGFGLVPNLALARLLGCAVEGGVVRVDELQGTSAKGVWCAGEGTGVAGVDASLTEGMIAGYVAAGRPGLAASHLRARDRARAFADRLRKTFAPRDEVRRLAEPTTLLCRCEDVPMSALSREWTARQAKLYTRIGMGPCQGRVCGPAAEYLFGWNPEGGRTPVSVATINTLAGAGDG